MIRKRPWLSLLIPVYNVEQYLAECIDSATAQADHGTEIILVDDGSTDNSWAILNELNVDHRLKVLRHEQNRGLSAARNTLLEASTGEYIWFIDSDDFLLPGAIPGLKKITDLCQPDLILCDYQTWRQQPKLKHRLRGELHRHTFTGPSNKLLQGGPDLIKGLFENGQMHIWTKIAKREIWGPDLRFPEGKYFEDMIITPRLALRVSNFVYVDQVWVAYRQRNGSILSTMSPSKANDLSEALVDYHQEYLKAWPYASPDSLFAIAYCSARNYICACREQRNVDDSSTTLLNYKNNLLASIGMPLSQLGKHYFLRGWLWRWARFIYWLLNASANRR